MPASKGAKSSSDDFTPVERRIFRAVAAALVDRPADESVVDAALAFVRRMSATDRRLLGLLLRTIEYSVPLLTGRPRRFSSLDRHRQQRFLNRWSRSRIKLRRQGAAALRALAMLGYYGRSDAWTEVGYDGPWLGRVQVPVLPATDLSATPVTQSDHLPSGITRGRNLNSDFHLRAQVCIIGSGAGGAAAAARLAEQGVDVVVIEAGGYHQAKDFTQRELEMLPLLFAEAGMQATADKAIGILQGRGVGGSTLHNTGLVVRPPAGILDRWQAEHALPADPPEIIRYAEQAVESLRAVPIPLDQINANNRILQSGAEEMGWRYQIPLHNRSECCGCGYCMLGCAYNRKNNATLTYLPRAVSAGARILSDATVLHIEGPVGARRVVCQLLDETGRPGGHQAIIESPLVMLAAGALQTPALLLRSGLGNANVGKGLRLHPAPLVAGLFDEPIDAWRGLPQSVIVDQFASFYDDGLGGFLLIALAGWPGLSAMLAPGAGPEHRELMRNLHRAASAVVLLHDETSGHVKIGFDGRPIARYWPNARDLAEIRRGVRNLAQLYLAAGAREVRIPYADAPPIQNASQLDAALERARPVPHRLSLNSVHPQGSCPLGASRRQSPVDPHGQVWDEPGLYVCDASLFPTSVGVPPQVTVMALATAVADHVVAEVAAT